MKLFTLIASITIFPIALYSSPAKAKVGPVEIRSDGPSNYNKGVKCKGVRHKILT